MAKYTQGIIIDNINYDIPMAKVSREYSFLEKYAERTEDGDIQMETIGGYQNYTIEIGIINDRSMYQRLYTHITDPQNRFHTVELPDQAGSFTFYGYFSSIKDEVMKIFDNGVVFKSLTWRMTSRRPTRRA